MAFMFRVALIRACNIALALLLIFVCASRADAQIGGSSLAGGSMSATGEVPLVQEPPDSWGQRQIGPLIFTPRIRLTRVGIDTNVFSSETDWTADFTATLQPEAEFFFGTSRFRARWMLRSDFVFYAKSGTERSINPSLPLELQWKLSRRVLLFSTHSAGLVKNRPNEEVLVRARRFSVGNTVGVQLIPTPRTFLRVVANHSTTSYGDASFRGVSLRETLDLSTSTLGAAAGYRLTPYTSLTAGGTVTQLRFANRADRDGRFRTSYFGLGFGERALLSGSAQVGYADYKADSPLTPDYNGVTGAASLSTNLMDRTQLSVGFGRELTFSYSPDTPYYVSDVYDGAIMQRIFSRLDIAAGVREHHFDYADSAAFGAQPDSKLRTYTVNTGVHVKKVRFGIFASYWTRPPSRMREGTRWGVTITTGRFNVNENGIFMNGLGQ